MSFSKSLYEIKIARMTCDRFTIVPNDIRGHRVIYDRPAKTCDHRRIQLRVGSLASEIDKFHDRFYPRPVLAFGYSRCLRLSVCPSVRVCGNHVLVRAITNHPFKLGSPSLDQRCKRPWLRSLLFCGTIDRDLQGQIELQSENVPHFELVHAIIHHQFKLQFPNLEQECILALFKSLPI